MLTLLLVIALDTLPPTLLNPAKADTIWQVSGNPLQPLEPYTPKKWTRSPAELPERKIKIVRQ